MADEFTWMRYPATGGVQAFPRDAVPNWKARGWVETAEPLNLPIWKDPAPEPEADVESAQEELARAEAEVIAAQERLAAARKVAAPATAGEPISEPAEKPVKKSTSARVTEADGKENGLG